MALDLGLGVYEETEVDGDFNEVGLDPLITSTTSVVVEDTTGRDVTPEPSAPSGSEQSALPSRHVPATGGADPGGQPGWSQPPPPPPQYGEAPAPYESGYSASAASATSTADVEQAGKLFLGGISWQTEENQLHAYFSSFGELVDVAVMRNKSTGISRGFGFITYRNADSVETVLSREHHLDGRRIDIKRAVPRDRAPPAVDRSGQRAAGGVSPYGPQFQQQHDAFGGYRSAEPAAYSNGQGGTRKLFVGGIPPVVTEPEFRQYFERFGAVVDAVVMYDRNTLRSRGFGFVTFAAMESARTVLSQPHQLQGKFVEVKSAEPKEVMNAHHAALSAAQQHHHHPHAHHHNYQQQPQQYVADAHHAMAQQHHYAQGTSSPYGAPDAVYHDARTGMHMSTQQHPHHAYASMPAGPPSHYHDPYHHAYQQHYAQSPQTTQQSIAQSQDLNTLEQQQQQHYAAQQRGVAYDNGQSSMGDAYAAYQQQRVGGQQQPYAYPPPPQDNFGGYRGQGGAPRNRDRSYRPYNG